MKFKRPIYKATLFIFLWFVFSADLPVLSKQIAPKAVKGVIDLRDWDFKRDEPVELSGEYEFYWKQHLLSSDFNTRIPPKIDGFIEVPGYWNGFEIDGNMIPGTGYATYRLNLLLDDRQGSLALRILSMGMGTAFRLYVNGDKLSSGGTPGKNLETTVPGYSPGVVDFEQNASRMEIILHVSNFHHRRGGVWEVIQLGNETDVRVLRESRLNFDLFLFGSIFIMALYHLGLFSLRKEDTSSLYFSVICFLVALRLLSTGERYLIHLFPNISWGLLSKFEYLSFYLALPAFALFMESIFHAFSRQIVRCLVALGLIFSSIVIFSPTRIFSYTIPLYEFIILSAFIYGLYVLIISLVRKEDSALVFSIGFVILFLTVINDILHVEKVVQTGYLAPFGFFIFFLSQAYLISHRFSMAHKTVEQQGIDLQKTLDAYKKEVADHKLAEEAR